MEHGLLRRYFAAFSKIPGFSNWVIAKASLELKKPEIKNICLRTEIGHSEMGNKYAEPGCSEISSVIRQKQDILKWIMGIVIETGMMLIKLSAV